MLISQGWEKKLASYGKEKDEINSRAPLELGRYRLRYPYRRRNLTRDHVKAEGKAWDAGVGGGISQSKR